LAIEFLADIYLEKAGTAESSDAEQLTLKAIELFSSLASTYDTIRKK
jgi:hypothetical protein